MSRADLPRAALVARWTVLTCETLPAMAAAHDWPIRLDHCFMRVCLDAVFGSPWTAVLPRPAVHAMSDDDLAAAIVVAEAIVSAPHTLVRRNAESLAGRRRARAAA